MSAKFPRGGGSRVFFGRQSTLPIQMFIKVASSPRLSGIRMPSPILWSHPLKMQRIVLLSSLLWWELGTNSLITGPGEWLSFRRFTSKLSWSWLTLYVTHYVHNSKKLNLFLMWMSAARVKLSLSDAVNNKCLDLFKWWRRRFNEMDKRFCWNHIFTTCLQSLD